jgi:hypothetical protein
MTIPAGFLAWHMVEPQSFIGAIGFIIVWSLLDYVFGFIATILIGIVASLFKS